MSNTMTKQEKLKALDEAMHAAAAVRAKKLGRDLTWAEAKAIAKSFRAVKRAVLAA